VSNETPTPDATEPVDVPAAVDGTEPAGTVEPIEAVEPVESVQPTEAVEPVESVQPTDAVEAVEAVEPVEAVDSVEPAVEEPPAVEETADPPAAAEDQAPAEDEAPAEEPAAGEAPAAAEDEAPAEEPAAGEAPAATEEPVVVHEPAVDEPAASEPVQADSAPAEAPAPAPAAPRPVAPSPAALAKRIAAVRPAAAPLPTTPDHSESARFGRVAEDGTVFVVSGEEERAVGSYPGASPEEALQYFARKYDEVFAMAELLEQRLKSSPELTAKDAAEQLAHLAEQMTEPAFVGDLEALQRKLDGIATAIETRREEETAQRAAAKAAAASEREALVARAEAIAAQDPAKVQWKRSGEELRAIFEEWKAHQRSSVKLDKPVETELWQRFSAARTAFDKARRAHFAELETVQAEAKALKERLVKEAEQLATSKDWGPTAREFKRLMDRWRAAGRAGRADDDALWNRFKAAQDAFFNAKDEVAAAQDQEFQANLAVKEELIAEANALLPITDLAATKNALRSIQERWEKAGKVPRSDIERTEKALRRVEQAVREAEDKKWSSSNPEARARAQSLVDQLEKAVAGLEQDLAAAREKGNDKKIKEAEAALQARQAWLDQARAGLAEFS